MKHLKLINSAIATSLVLMNMVVMDSTSSPAQATQSFVCTGKMNNQWQYTAQFVDGRFTQVTWNRAGQPPQVSSLTFSSTNNQGQPIYNGSFQAATAVTLIDLSGGDVRPGSQISVSVEEWGTSTGTCGLSSTLPPPQAQNLLCTGNMKNQWRYTAEFVDDRFTKITWNRAGQPPQVSRLTFSSNNAQGEPVYNGSFQAATTVTLTDLSRGNVRPGSEILVNVEEWGSSRGICHNSSSTQR